MSSLSKDIFIRLSFLEVQKKKILGNEESVPANLYKEEISIREL